MLRRPAVWKFMGVMLAAWKTRRPQSWSHARRYANFSLLAGLLGLALSFWLFRDRVGLVGNTLGWPVLSFALGLLVFAGAGRDSVIGRLDIPLTAWLATISYSLYLMHKQTYHLIQTWWGSNLTGTGLFAVFVYGGTAVLTGAALHYAVELPCLRLRKTLLPRS